MKNVKIWAVAALMSFAAQAKASEIFWECSITSNNVGGLALGLGHSIQLLAGEGFYECRGRDHRGRIVRNYEERVKLAFLGGGVGLGASLVTSMKVRAVGIQLGKLDPRHLIGTRFGAGVDIGVHVLEDAVRGMANVSFSDASGVMLELSLSELRGLGLHAGAHISGFIMHEENYEGIIVGSLKQIGVIFSEGLKRSGGNVTEFSPDHVVASQAEAKERAESEHRGYRNFGLNIRKGNPDLRGDALNDFVQQGIRQAHNTCAASSLRTVYAVPACEGAKCSAVHLRVVCN